MQNKEELLPFDLEFNNANSEKNSMFNSIIKVIGVGGGGGNAVNNMFNEGIKDVDFVIANTDKQVLENSPIEKKIQLGATLTEGLGAGNNPEVGKNAAKESVEQIKNTLNDGTKMVFITAGMGGGTGTGAAPVIAEISREMGILTVGIVSIPFLFEGELRISNAVQGLNEMKKNVDALIIINNEKISEVYPKFKMSEAFKFADQVLTTAAKGIAEIITKKGLVNVDFADVRSVLKDSGVAVMGTGHGKGDDRGIIAVKGAIESPLLNNNDIIGAKNLLVNVYSPRENEITTEEMAKIQHYLQEKTGFKANNIWGLSIDDELESDQCYVTVIATAFDDNIIPTAEELLNSTKITKFPKKEKTTKQSDEQINKTEQIEETEVIDEQTKMQKIKESIENRELKPIDYQNDKIVDEYHDKPALYRMTNDFPTQLNFNSNINSYLEPGVD